FTDPVSGEAVWVEYRDGKGIDANTFYATGNVREEIVDAKDLRDCKAEHGASAVECNTLHRFRPGVRVYHLEDDLDARTIALTRGFGSDSALSAGQELTGRGGGYTVSVSSVMSTGA